jgi:hypothetical protein
MVIPNQAFRVRSSQMERIRARSNETHRSVGRFLKKAGAMFIQADTASWGDASIAVSALKACNIGHQAPNSAFTRRARAHYDWGTLDAYGQVALCRSADFRYNASRIIGG